MPFLRLAAVTMLIAAPVADRQLVGGFGTWGAFCDGPKRCFAIAEPNGRDRQGHLVIVFPGGETRVETGRPVRSLRLIVGGGSIGLMTQGTSGRTADAKTAWRVIGRIRAADGLIVEGVSATGRRFRQHYGLAGAPSAIDAAIVATVSGGTKGGKISG